jgi:thiol-disulfide isomerase/thioredoxin
MRFGLILILFVGIQPLYAQKMSDSIPVLTGKISIQQLQAFTWHTNEYAKYACNKDVIDSLKPFAQQLKLIVVMGTWCSDSREHIPALLRVADAAGVPQSHIELLGVDRTKKCSHPDITPMNIEYVPTIFIFLNGKLVGTIVETPKQTIEKDLLHLVTPNTSHD